MIAPIWAILVGVFAGRLWLMFPLCLVIALVYQATRREDMARILRSGLRLFVVLSVGMIVAAVILFLISCL